MDALIYSIFLVKFTQFFLLCGELDILKSELFLTLKVNVHGKSVNCNLGPTTPDPRHTTYTPTTHPPTPIRQSRTASEYTAHVKSEISGDKLLHIAAFWK